ncbi:sodium ion-translocating decarboxylase subunit beta [Halarsenatibacter silvermanii]|uniref:Glutaconyl-CoA decarboxylase beta subunit n=1 Tax=Halarsenatibacter silvermanii TaxID=321763 RepID=A0A1G9I918_9FIRM|nr:sodium ion-translocating decarboxylase subunit beta [Halarsenatibacter silvermanii]SDL21586.1 glutaconyl-CoA decarboxylase beta subunit [Halarsenatibacter silvermanii]
MAQAFLDFMQRSGLFLIGIREIIMITVAVVLIYLGIKKEYEPLLLIPIGFGMLLVNLPMTGLMEEAVGDQPAGLFHYFYLGNELGIFPPLIFLGIGAMTDFGPLLANPKSMLLGAAAQFGIFMTFIGAILLGFTGPQSASIGVIGGADGPTAIYISSLLSPEYLGPIAISAYAYMALVPIIQPPIIKLLTSREERRIKMEQLRSVSQKEKIIFPLAVAILVVLLVPASAPLVGMLMLGNLFRESGVVDRLSKVARNALINIVTILLGVGVGASASADRFLRADTLQILLLGVVAFSFGTATGLILGKIMNRVTSSRINPMIGAAGVSAVPMAARVVNKVGQQENSSNFLLMHAMGPNVAGVIGSAVAAGVMLSIFA